MLKGRRLQSHTAYAKHGVKPPTGDAQEPTVAAGVNHGAWCVECPSCHSAVAYAAAGEAWFYCLDCGNAEHDGKRLPIAWPDDADAIETALSLRAPANQNWRPGETVDDLMAENLGLKRRDVVPASALGALIEAQGGAA